MILDNARELSDRFYNYLLKCRSRGVEFNRLLMLAASDVDSVCAVKILLHLFHCDHIQYSLTVCSRFQDCVDAVAAAGDSVRTILMINCGAAESVVERLNVSDKVRIYILDSRMPVHLRNLYSAKQVCVLRKFSQEDIQQIPRWEEVFREEEQEENENGAPDGEGGKETDDNDDVMSQSSQNFRGDAGRARARKRREKERELREWNSKRIAVEEGYYKNVYYQDSSAVRMFELAHLVSKDDQELFFWAVIGLCEMFMQRKIGSTEFVEKSVALQGHVIRLTHSIDLENQQNFRITYGQDLALRFYRQWSIFESLNNTPYTVAIFRAWENKGHAKLHEFLADMGLALAQCKQTYSAMDFNIRRDMMEWFQAQAPEWNVPDLISGGSFLATYGFNQKFQINDMALGLFACLTVNSDKSSEDNFHDALDTLSKHEFDRLDRALQMGRDQLVVLRKIVQSAFEEKLFVGMTHYVQVCLDNISTAGTQFAGRPEVLIPLAHFLQETYVVMSRGQRVKKAPFVLVAQLQPPSTDGTGDFLHVVGLPGADNVAAGMKNFMGKAFRAAARQAKVELELDSFEECLVRIGKRSKTAFLDALIIALSAAPTEPQSNRH
ncbi:Cell division control protein 45-like protein [Hypsibius exemplaris]|uniref:Cell division control protein 45-like protein n=1 Tax=Hypsibius exemplaris TaxID=2072580 RepID=A0A9X6N8M7_HYPEX|nr:Cell division control protein 45-like protein [Hypsibius exemplaris]